MRNTGWIVAMLTISLLMTAGTSFCARAGSDDGEGDFPMYVSPKMIVESAPCDQVTIHTEVRFNDVGDSVVMVDGEEVDIVSSFSDNRGNFVARLDFEDVMEIVSPPSAEIELSLVVDGFSMETVVEVRVKR